MSTQTGPLEKVSVTDMLLSNGESAFNGQVTFGEGLPTTVSLQKAIITGAFPLTFESNDASGKTLTLHTPSLGKNVVITLPDESGTLLNALPSVWAVDDTLAIAAPGLDINVDRIALGAALSSSSGPHSFTFSDVSSAFHAQDNEFAVMASGGVRMCASPAPAAACVQLLPGDLSWRSRFSNASAMNLSRVNEEAALAAVASLVDVYSWHFASSPESGHIGPMPQDWAQLLSSLHIPTVDASSIAAADVDGVLLASVRELNRRLLAAESALHQLQQQQQEQHQQQQQQLLQLQALIPTSQVAFRLALCVDDDECEESVGCSGAAGSDESAQVVAALGVCTPLSFATTASGNLQSHSIICSTCGQGRAACTWYDNSAECLGFGAALALKADGLWASTAGTGAWTGGVCSTLQHPAGSKISYRGFCAADIVSAE
jgi:hypothetical protein